MGDMREIVDLATIERLLRLAAAASPVIGAAVGLAVGSRRGRAGRSLLLGLLAGLVGPLVWCLWRVFNAVTDRNGLDTVRNLFINLALFAVIGAVLGFGARLLLFRSPSAPEKPESTGKQQG